MTKQRLNEWVELDALDIDYHQRQWESEYRSTGAFAEFIADHVAPSRFVIDLACGAGGATFALSKRFMSAEFLGLDISTSLIQIAQEKQIEKAASNLSFESDDWFNLRSRENVDGVISLQALSWLPVWKPPLEEIVSKLQPKWMAFSSLFYEGDISCRIEITEHIRNRTSFSNVYSVPEISRWASSRGFKLAKFKKFEIDIDLPPTGVDSIRTYTERLEAEPGDIRRLQIGGPLLMNWAFLLLVRSGGA
jgi:SAM-dependent methyltransferase